MADETLGPLDALLNLMTPADNVYLITPHDTNYLGMYARGISFAVAGDLKITDIAGNDVVIPSGALAAGVIHPIRAKKVWASGTTATGIVGYC